MLIRIERCIRGPGNAPIVPNATGPKVKNSRPAIRFLPPRLWPELSSARTCACVPSSKFVDLIQQEGRPLIVNGVVDARRGDVIGFTQGSRICMLVTSPMMSAKRTSSSCPSRLIGEERYFEHYQTAADASGLS